AGALSALITLALSPRFEVWFRVPDHPTGYGWTLKYLIIGCSSLGGAIGFSVSGTLVWAHRVWTRCVISLLLAFITLPPLLYGLYAIRMHGFPDLTILVHAALVTLSLGVPAVLLLTLLHPLLVEGRTLKRLSMLSLPTYVL